jgi:hypothetical protein
MTSLTIVVRSAVLIALALIAAACMPSMREQKSLTRHLVYDKLVCKGIWIAGVDGSRPRLLVRDGHEPALSPDGNLVAYLAGCGGAGPNGGYELRIVPSSGGKARVLARDIAGFTWSPDSERIAASRPTPDGGGALLGIDVSSAELVTLTRGSLYGWSFSPDGSRIVFARSDWNPDSFGFFDQRVDLFVGEPESSKATRITDSGDNGYPVWGPESIAFAKLVEHDGWGAFEIWRIAPDGKGRESITGRTPERFLGKDHYGLIPVDWSDDGSTLLGAWLTDFDAPPLAVDPETGELRELGRELGPGLRTAGLSRDGRVVLVETSVRERLADATIVLVPYGGGKPMVVARAAQAPSWNR